MFATSYFLRVAAAMLIRGRAPLWSNGLSVDLLAAPGWFLTLSAQVLLGLHWDLPQLARWSGVRTLAVLIALARAIGH